MRCSSCSGMLRQLLFSTIQKGFAVQCKQAQPVAAAAHKFFSSPAGSGSGKKPALNNANVPIVDYEDPDYLPIPEYPKKLNETLEVQKQRLIYQSRKRGMLENDLLLSTFVHKYLKGMDQKLTDQYDALINGVSNDWDIYYWATKTKPTPPEHNNEIMHLLQEHCNNTEKEPRYQQPDLEIEAKSA